MQLTHTERAPRRPAGGISSLRPRENASRVCGMEDTENILGSSSSVKEWRGSGKEEKKAVDFYASRLTRAFTHRGEHADVARLVSRIRKFHGMLHQRSGQFRVRSAAPKDYGREFRSVRIGLILENSSGARPPEKRKIGSNLIAYHRYLYKSLMMTS